MDRILSLILTWITFKFIDAPRKAREQVEHAGQEKYEQEKRRIWEAGAEKRRRDYEEFVYQQAMLGQRFHEVTEALIGFGYPRKEATDMAASLVEEYSTTEECIRVALIKR